MQICKSHIIAASLSFIFNIAVFSQVKMPEMPSMTNISNGPAMPRISAPTLGTKFYVPGNVYTNKKNEVVIKSADEPVEPKHMNSGLITDDNSILSKKISESFSSRLTAKDISSLGSDGLFGGIYGLLGDDNSILTKAYQNTTSSDVLLSKIMEQLNELKLQNEKLTEQLRISSENQNNTAKKSEMSPKILRFVVNGYNLLDTCRTVYFSKKDFDGSFLLTGDRRYTSDNKSRDETFYLLFKADGNCGSTAGFYVEPKVVQDYKNEYSFLYQLSKKHDLKAEKTGNLVSLRCTEPAWNFDLLLDIGSE